MPVKNSERRYAILRALDDVYQENMSKHYAAAPKGGIPAGGGDWVDYFFKSEGLRGAIGYLRSNKNPTIEGCIAEGLVVSQIAIKIWNTQREYQVHRWENSVEEFIRYEVTKAYRCRGEWS